MICLHKSLTAAVIGASVFAPFVSTEQAAAFPVAPAVSHAAQPSNVAPVYWRGHGGWGWWGPGVLFGGIVGGALVASAVAEHRADRVDMDRCARDFPDFSYRTGTYIDRRGDERVCPYLR